MKTKLKRIIIHLLKIIYKFIFSCFSLLKVGVFSKYTVKLPSINDFGTCYIFGNGPSLKNDLDGNCDFFIDKNIFVVNNFATSDYFNIIKPKYYVFADPAYWSSNENSEVVRNCKKILEIIRDTTSWNMTIFVPSNALKNNILTDVLKSNKFLKIVDFNTTVISMKGFEYLNYLLFKKGLAAPPIQNVLISSIFISINIGFSEINILGSDHSWTKQLFVNEKNDVCTIDYHFYDAKQINYNVFTRVDGSIYKMHEILRDYALMFEGYHKLRKYADYFKVKIWNATENSFIDAFERKNYINS
ncbi:MULTISPECIES: hypothetical protein [Flavobacterium]|uniref:DUF115 domain-containing protein n=1 Tax=Flavobacterium endoglycinae TaxID=2816357 RepID=A0ABX7Q8V5_9FLAO|nr:MULTISPECIES: hypothetical protein [Flavobacterium]QSW87456.1 hypothetical protein J0383_14290 [Flavobacterium endoglycinae]